MRCSAAVWRWSGCGDSAASRWCSSAAGGVRRRRRRSARSARRPTRATARRSGSAARTTRSTAATATTSSSAAPATTSSTAVAARTRSTAGPAMTSSAAASTTTSCSARRARTRCTAEEQNDELDRRPRRRLHARLGRQGRAVRLGQEGGRVHRGRRRLPRRQLRGRRRCRPAAPTRWSAGPRRTRCGPDAGDRASSGWTAASRTTSCIGSDERDRMYGDIGDDLLRGQRRQRRDPRRGLERHGSSAAPATTRCSARTGRLPRWRPRRPTAATAAAATATAADLLRDREELPARRRLLRLSGSPQLGPRPVGRRAAPHARLPRRWPRRLTPTPASRRSASS